MRLRTTIRGCRKQKPHELTRTANSTTEPVNTFASHYIRLLFVPTRCSFSNHHFAHEVGSSPLPATSGYYSSTTPFSLLQSLSHFSPLLSLKLPSTALPTASSYPTTIMTPSSSPSHSPLLFHHPDRDYEHAHPHLPPTLPNRSFLYPILGIPTLLSTPSLHPFLLSRLLPLTLLSLITLTLMFTLLYLPHVLLLSIFHGPLAWTNAIFMILSESSTLIALLAEAFFTEHQCIDIVDSIFISAGFSHLVARCRHIGPNGELGEHKIYPYLKFRSSARQTFWYVVELPLCFIPLVGWPVFLALQGWHLGRWQQLRYWQLLGYGRKEREDITRRNRWRYWAFGVVHVLLQLVPVASIFFLFSTAAGAGMWAVEAERRKMRAGWGSDGVDEQRGGEGVEEGAGWHGSGEEEEQWDGRGKSFWPWKR